MQKAYPLAILLIHKELYGADILPVLFLKSLAVLEQVIEPQSPPLDTVYPLVSLDCILLK